MAIATVPDTPALGPVLSHEFISTVGACFDGVGVLALSLHAYSLTIEFRRIWESVQNDQKRVILDAKPVQNTQKVGGFSLDSYFLKGEVLAV